MKLLVSLKFNLHICQEIHVMTKIYKFVQDPEHLESVGLSLAGLKLISSEYWARI